MWTEISDHTYNFQRSCQEIRALVQVTQLTLLHFYDTYFLPVRLPALSCVTVPFRSHHVKAAGPTPTVEPNSSSADSRLAAVPRASARAMVTVAPHESSPDDPHIFPRHVHDTPPTPPFATAASLPLRSDSFPYPQFPSFPLQAAVQCRCPSRLMAWPARHNHQRTATTGEDVSSVRVEAASGGGASCPRLRSAKKRGDVSGGGASSVSSDITLDELLPLPVNPHRRQLCFHVIGHGGRSSVSDKKKEKKQSHERYDSVREDEDEEEKEEEEEESGGEECESGRSDSGGSDDGCGSESSCSLDEMEEAEAEEDEAENFQLAAGPSSSTSSCVSRKKSKQEITQKMMNPKLLHLLHHHRFYHHHHHHHQHQHHAHARAADGLHEAESAPDASVWLSAPLALRSARLSRQPAVLISSNEELMAFKAAMPTYPSYNA